jgi:transposase
MRLAPSLELTVEQRSTLQEWARARSLPARVVERARIVLHAAAGEQDKEIARQLGMTPKKVSRWRKRFLALGLPGLEKDAPPDPGAPARSAPARSSEWWK